MQKTLHWLESLNQVRYQLIAYDGIGYLLLDLGLYELAVENMERGLALGDKTGIMFWRGALCTHLAVARTRLGQKIDAAPLQAMLEQSRTTSERYMMVRCIDGLAEITLAAGDTRGSCTYSDELLEISKANDLYELEAVARRWRGVAMLLTEDYDVALTELNLAAEQAEKVGRVRLQMDVHAALARLYSAQGRSDGAQHHGNKAREIAEAIEHSLESTELVAHLPEIYQVSGSIETDPIDYEGDHQHMNGKELKYRFVSVDKLVADFFEDVKRRRNENGND